LEGDATPAVYKRATKIISENAFKKLSKQERNQLHIIFECCTGFLQSVPNMPLSKIKIQITRRISFENMRDYIWEKYANDQENIGALIQKFSQHFQKDE
jgi:hypothetical protein